MLKAVGDNMKKYIKASTEYVISVSICYGGSLPVAASEYLKKLDTIPQAHQIPDELISELNDLIDSVVTVLNKHKFDVKQGHQSKDGYTYYIPFYPIMSTGEHLDEFLIVFRISDHFNKGLSESEVVKDYEDLTIFRTFTLGSDKYPTSVSILKAVNETCAALEHLGYDGL